MVALGRMRIGAKIYAVVGMMAILAAGIAAMGQWAIISYDSHMAEIIAASRRAVVGERVGGDIYSVVMNSRGVYMSRDAKEVMKFGAPLLKTLERLDAHVAQWKALIPPSQSAAFTQLEGHLKQFLAFRRELVRLGVEVGAPAAREYGDNDANRSNRQALGQQVAALADINNGEIDGLEAEVAAFSGRLKLIILAAAGLGIGCGGALAMRVVNRSVARPVASLAAATKALAGGALAHPVPGIERGDEMGDLARAVEIFRDSMMRNRSMEAQAAAEQAAKAERALGL